MLMYVRMKPRFETSDLPVILFSEIDFADPDGEGWEVRKLAIFSDGDIRYAFDEMNGETWYEISSGRRTHVANQPYTQGNFINSIQGRFATEAAFHRLWNIALRKHPVARRTPLHGATKLHSDDLRP